MAANPTDETTMHVTGESLGLVDGLDAAAMIADALSRALELHDYRRGMFAETADHGARVTRLAERLTARVSPELAADPRLRFAFQLHDIGMIGVSDSTRVKPGALTRAELDEIREHPLLGERIIAPIAFLGSLARQVVGAHHERWDGGGYPRGLAAGDVPLAARIFALADAYESMTTAQPYRTALPHRVVLEEIARGAGQQFDPELARLFVELVATA